MKSNWNYPTTVWVGEKRIDDLSLACKNLKINNPLFVTDKDLIGLPMVKNVLLKLKKSFEKLSIFSNFSGNPIGENVEEGVLEFKNNNCDGVIAFGGGSGLDVGKAIAFMSGQSRPIWDFEDIGDYWKRADENNIAPIIAVPTTAGTGSETGRASAIINKKNKIKKIIEKPSNPKSNLAITGLYFFNYKVVDFAKTLKSSKRNELEIVDLLNIYLKNKSLKSEFMGRGSAWLDTGNATNLFNASQYIAAIEERQGLKIACIEEISYQNKWISKKQILKIINFYGKCDYSDYLKKII